MAERQEAITSLNFPAQTHQAGALPADHVSSLYQRLQKGCGNHPVNASTVKFEQEAEGNKEGRFRSRVVLNLGIAQLDGEYPWSKVYSRKKAAKHEAARLAFESLPTADKLATCGGAASGPEIRAQSSVKACASSTSSPEQEVSRQCIKLGWALETAQVGKNKWQMAIQAQSRGIRVSLAFEAEGRNHKAARQACFEKAQQSARLQALIDAELQKVEITLDDAFTQDFCAQGGRVVPASRGAWGELRRKLHSESRNGRGMVVGVDVEGTNHRPPLLVQVAGADMVVLEVPSASSGLRYKSLARLF